MQGDFIDFNQIVKKAFGSVTREIAPPALSEKQVLSVRTYFRDLLAQWENLAPGSTLTFTFDIL